MGSVLRVGARRARRLLLLGGVAFSALPAAPALADTTIGQTGGTPGLGGLCTTITPGAAYADSGYVVPSGGGTITSFSFRSDSSNALEPLDFLVLRPEGSKYRVVGTTGMVTLAGTGLETFPANIPVAGGDILGFWFPSRLDNCFRAGIGPVIAKIPASDPDTGDLIAMQGNGPADLNESANLASPAGRPPPPRHLFRVPLLHNDTAGCVSGAEPAPPTGNGFAVIHKVGDTVRAEISLKNGLPNTTYNVRLIQTPSGSDCFQLDTTLTTNGKGNGDVHWSEPLLPGSSGAFVTLTSNGNTGDTYVTTNVRLR